MAESKDTKQIKDLNKEFRFFTEECDVPAKSAGKLSEYTVSLKDAILLEGVESKAHSKILSGYKPVFNSTVAERILSSGGKIIGKAAQDAFGFGSFGTNVGVGYEIPLNPFDKERCTGGSSGGCASVTSLASKHISIAESTGGSIVTPAAFCGVVGICPTYGRVSRNGLISYAASLDKIGVMSKTVKESAMMLSVIAGRDEMDETSSDMAVPDYESFCDDSLSKSKGKKIGVLRPSGVDAKIQSRVDEVVKSLESKGIITEEISMPFMEKYSLAAYYIIAMSEASTHLACLCGLRYGQAGKSEDFGDGYDSYFSKVRTENFNEETKRRIMLGTYTRMSGYRGQYYVKALKVRTKIIAEYKSLFAKYDAIVVPTVPFIAPKFDDIKKLTPMQNYASDFITVGPNLAGLPHITVPVQSGDASKENMPFGIMLIGDHFKEDTLFTLGSAVETIKLEESK